MKLKDIKLNKNNPRIIKDDKFNKLKKSISEFPKMLELRPMILDEDNVVLGGNMRLQALKDLQYTEIPDNWVKYAKDLTDEQKQRFIISDNISYGIWDWDIIANEWDSELLLDWGLDIPFYEETTTKEIETVELQPFIKTHILLSFSPELLTSIQEYISKIKETEGIEYEQSSN